MPTKRHARAQLPYPQKGLPAFYVAKLIDGITRKNRHIEIDSGGPIGNEIFGQAPKITSLITNRHGRI
jgi:hypothetical protein